MLRSIIFMFILTGYFTGTAQVTDQYAHIQFEKNVNAHKLSVTAGDIPVSHPPHSYLQQSDIDMEDENGFEFKLHKGNYEDDFTIEFQLDKIATNILSIGLRYVDPNPSNHNLYTFYFKNDNYYIQTPNGDYLVGSNYTQEDIFRIDKCMGFVSFYHDNVLVYYLEILEHDYEASLYLENAESTNCFMHFYQVEDCQTNSNSSNYMVVKTKVFDDCAILSQPDKLNFYYLQKYKIVPSINEEVEFKIYDLNHEIVPFNGNDSYFKLQKYGSNFFSLDFIELGLSLNQSECYLLEVIGPNKNSTYFLKFQIPVSE